MAIPQQKFREAVFQMLYSLDIGQSRAEDMIPLLMKELSITKKAARLALTRAEKILEEKKKIDQLIAETAVSYDFKRIQSVERNVLRLGVFELLYDEEIPEKVAITEAMRLARKFGSPEGASFVNAVLDNIYKHSQGKKVDPTELNAATQALEKSEEHAKNTHTLRTPFRRK